MGVSKKNQNSIVWKSSKKYIVSVNQKGRIRAKQSGKASITAMYKGKKYTCRVFVTNSTETDRGHDNSNTENDSADLTPDTSHDNSNIEDSSADFTPDNNHKNPDTNAADTENDIADLTLGTSYYRGFLADNVFHSKQNGEIHYDVYFPDSYDGKTNHALFVTLPGYQGLYFQGVAENIKTEDFVFEAQKYNHQMIVLAPQLSDWGETSADQTIALTEYFLSHYKVDPSKFYINGYSGGGETLSLVLGKNRSFLRLR